MELHRVGANWESVRPLAVIVLVGAMTGCASPMPESVELEPIDAPHVTVEAELGDPDSQALTEPAPLECLPRGFAAQLPALPSYPEPTSARCRPIRAFVRAQLRDDLRDDWFYAQQSSTLDIDFGCDRLGEIEEITVQMGGGHGGTLDLARLQPVEGGGEWEVLLLRHAANRYVPDDRPAGAYRGRVDASAVSRALDRSRAALVVEVEEKLDPSQTRGLTSSSGDFHAFLRLVDGRGNARAVGFSGYPDSEAQLDWRVPSLASWSLLELVETAQLDPVELDGDSQRLFAERFVESEAAGYHGEFSWWVHERFIELAGVHGTLDLVPGLARRLCPTIDPEASAPVGPMATASLRAIFELLGHGEPIVLDDDERLEPELAARWIAACEVSCPAPAQD